MGRSKTKHRPQTFRQEHRYSSVFYTKSKCEAVADEEGAIQVSQEDRLMSSEALEAALVCLEDVEQEQ